MKSKNLVSIIIPVYNVEKFLNNTVESVINQTYKNIEILLIDDGSTDKSSQICDEWANKDKRIKVFHKKNGGVSSARNKGISEAKGIYITFIDGDDYVSNDYVDYLYNLVNDNNVLIGMNYFCYNIVSSNQTEKINNEIIDSEKAIIEMYESKINVAVWNKIYNLSFLKNNNITFNESIWFGEGMLFNMKCLSLVDKISIGNKKVYYQVYNTSSAMRKFNINSRKNGIKSIELQKKLFLDRSEKINNAINYHLRCTYMSILIQILKSGTVKKYKNEYNECIKEIKGNYSIVKKSNISKKKKLFYLVAKFFPVLVAKRVIYKENKFLKTRSKEIK